VKLLWPVGIRTLMGRKCHKSHSRTVTCLENRIWNCLQFHVTLSPSYSSGVTLSPSYSSGVTVTVTCYCSDVVTSVPCRQLTHTCFNWPEHPFTNSLSARICSAPFFFRSLFRVFARPRKQLNTSILVALALTRARIRPVFTIMLSSIYSASASASSCAIIIRMRLCINHKGSGHK
jgi:hypothetical protein